MGGQGLTALAFLIVALAWLSRRQPLDAIVVPGHFHDLGEPDARLRDVVGVLLVLAVPDHLVGQSSRGDHLVRAPAARGWRFIGLGLIVFHFAVPFLLLLFSLRQARADDRLEGRRRHSRRGLVDLFWLIAPEFHRDRLVVSWMDVVLPLSLVALWLGCFIWQLRGRAILPVHDPQFEEALGRYLRADGNGRRPVA